MPRVATELTVKSFLELLYSNAMRIEYGRTKDQGPTYIVALPRPVYRAIYRLVPRARPYLRAAAQVRPLTDTIYVQLSSRLVSRLAVLGDDLAQAEQDRRDGKDIDTNLADREPRYKPGSQPQDTNQGYNRKTQAELAADLLANKAFTEFLLERTTYFTRSDVRNFGNL